MNEKTFIFLGRSGCGKGTQAELLKKYLAEKTPDVPCFHLEVGAKFREFIGRDTYTSGLSREVNARGGLQPEFLAIWAWSSVMIKQVKGGEHMIIDGTPRKLREACVLEKALEFYGRDDVHVIFLDVSRAWSRERMLSRKRADDNDKDIEARLDWYDKDVVPAVSYFRKNRHFSFHDIGGEQPAEKVHADIIAAIENPKPKNFSLLSFFR